MAVNASVLKSLAGRKVAVFSIVSNGSARDDGVVRTCDDQCLIIEKGSETLVFIIANIRLIKVLE